MAKKSNISLKNLLVIVAAALAIAACCMMFLPAIKFRSGSYLKELEGLKVLFGGAEVAGLAAYEKGATGSFIGYVLAGVGGVALIVSRFVEKKYRFVVCAVAFITIVAAAVLIFLEATFFMSANGERNGTNVIGQPRTFKLTTGPIIGGIASALSAVLLIVTSVAKD